MLLRTAIFVLTPLCLVLSGCGDPGSPSEVRTSPEPAAEVGRARVAEEAPPAAELRGPSVPALLLARGERSPSPDSLAGWARDPELDPAVRYTSFQALASQDPDASLTVALSLVGDEASLRDPRLGPNAIATLARSDDPRAAQALAGLSPRDRRLARILRSRRP